MGHTVRLAIAGFGLVGRRHADAIAQSTSATLAAVIEPDREAQGAAEAAGCATFGDLGSFFAKGKADGVILATPNRVHADQALDCIAQRLPVLVEKPITSRAIDAERVVAEAKAGDVPLLVGHHRRHNPLIQKAKAMIEAGAVGDIRAVQAMCWFYKPDTYFDAAEWRKEPGAGPVAVNLVHDIDLLRYLCGDITTVRAVGRTSSRGYENEDVASALLEFASGAVGTVTVSDSIVAPWSWELTSSEYPVYPKTQENCYLIGGSKGSLSIPDLRLWHYGNGARDWWSEIQTVGCAHDSSDPLINQIEHFAAVIKGDAAPLVSGLEGLKSLRVIEAVQHSIANGEVVRLPDTVYGE